MLFQNFQELIKLFRISKYNFKKINNNLVVVDLCLIIFLKHKNYSILNKNIFLLHFKFKIFFIKTTLNLNLYSLLVCD